MYEAPDFKEVFEEFQPKIVNYLSRLLENQNAEDIAQEVFAKVSRGLETFKGQSISTGFRLTIELPWFSVNSRDLKTGKLPIFSRSRLKM